MLNYIWAGLIVFSFIFAITNDLRDFSRDTYRNGQALPITIEGATDAADATPQPVTVRINPATYATFYKADEKPAATYAATIVRTSKGRELRFPASAELPPRLAKIRDMTSAADPKWLLADVTDFQLASDGTAAAAIRFQPVRWVSMQAISEAAMNMAKTAVTLSLGLIGTLAVFLGLMQIAEKAGLIQALVFVTGPLLRPLFPGIPRGHPAMGLVTLNLTANMLGLGNAATPFGIKAMEELQKLNKTTDTATNAMVMLLAMNTAGVQLLPPMMLYAVLGLRASELYFPILIVTGVCLVIAIVATKLLELLPGYRRSDPDLAAVPALPVASVEVAR